MKTLSPAKKKRSKIGGEHTDKCKKGCPEL